MKKYLSVLLAVVLMIMLSACSSAKEPVVDPTTVPDAADSPEVSADPTAEPTVEPEEASFEHGSWEGNTFTNSFAGLTVTVPQDDAWVILSDEDLAELMQITLDNMEDANALQKAMAKVATVQDMMAQNAETNASMILMFENLTLQGATSYSAQDWADNIVAGLKARSDIAYTVGDVGSLSLCGKEYVLVPAQAADYGMNQSYLMRREGNYMIEIILTGAGEETIDELVAMFAE